MILTFYMVLPSPFQHLYHSALINNMPVTFAYGHVILTLCAIFRILKIVQSEIIG